MNQFYTFINPLILFPLLAIACLIYYFTPGKYRWLVLAVFSLGFYFWIGSWAILILVLSILSNYLIGIWISKSLEKNTKIPMIAGILINLALWVGFKYGGEAVSPLLQTSSANNLIYPIGLSFFTLQNIGYLVDVSKKLIPVERNLGIFAAFISFFPKIAAGPIERGKNLIPQFRQEHSFEWENITWGTRQIAFGLFKKLVLADRLAFVANEVFDHPGAYQGLSLAFGILSFAFQLYFDFSGYSDLALGIARLFGFKLTVNFKLPYLAEDIVEFWNRWHISLSTWLRDYIFYPTRRFILKRFKSAMLLAAVLPPLLTMLASGFWHGTGWTFILWGLYHAGLYILVILRKNYLGIEKKLQTPWLKYPKILVNFGFVSIGWILFRASSILNAKIIVYNLFLKNITLKPLFRSMGEYQVWFALIIICAAIIFEALLNEKAKQIDNLPLLVRWSAYFVILLMISAFGIYQASGNPFVYFRF